MKTIYKWVLPLTLATLLLIGCGGGSDSNSGTGSSLISPYAGEWDITFNNSLQGTYTIVYSVSNSGSISSIMERNPNCSGNPSFQIVGNGVSVNHSYPCIVNGMRCAIREFGIVTFTSNTTASGTLMEILSCVGVEDSSITTSVRGVKRLSV